MRLIEDLNTPRPGLQRGARRQPSRAPQRRNSAMKKFAALLLALGWMATSGLGDRDALAQTAQKAAPEKAPPEKAPPLTKDHLYKLLDLQVSSVDILVELSQRGIDVAISEEILKELESRGADSLLLNQVSQYYLDDASSRQDLEIFLREERYQRVIEVADLLIARAPRLLPAWIARAQAQLKLKEVTAAEKDLLQILKYAPGHSDAQFLLAQALSLNHREREAVDLLAEVLSRLSASAYRLRGECYFLRAQISTQKGNHRQAADDFQRALVYAPTVMRIWSEASELFARSGDLAVRSPAAAKELAIAIQLAAGDDALRVLAQLRLAEAEASGGNYGQAKVHLDLTKAFSPNEEQRGKIARLREEIGASQFSTWQPTSTEMGKEVDAATSIRSQLATMEPTPPSKESAFLLGTRAVNQKEWAEVMGMPPPREPQSPQEGVSWNEAQVFITKLNQLSTSPSTRFRLPTRNELVSAIQRPAGKAASPADRLEKKSPEAIAVWCDDPYSPEGAQPRSQTPFRMTFGDVTFADSASDKVASVAERIDFAPATARWRGLGLRLAATPSAEKNIDKSTPSRGEGGFARSIDLAARAKEWDPYSSFVGGIGLQSLLQLEISVRLKEGDLPGAISSTRLLIREADTVNPRRADFARCLLALIAAKQVAATGDQKMQRELEEAVDLVRGRNRKYGYWFAEYARAELLRHQQNWSEARISAERALSQSPNPMHEKCRNLLELTKSSNFTAIIDPPSLPEALGEGYLPIALNP